MGSEKIYVPILKWKGGERIALRNLKGDIKKMICPVLLVMKNTEADTFVTEVCQNWGINREFYLDFHHDFSGNHTEFMEMIINEASSSNLAIIPVITIDHTTDYIQLIDDNNDFFRHGIALRIRSLDSKMVQDLYDSIDNLADQFEGKIDLILDTGVIGHLPSDSLEMYSAIVINVINNIHHLYSRNIILTGSSFPESISVKQNDISSISRMEWLLWKLVTKEYPHVLFGDYGVDDPNDPVYENRVTIIPTIRYTHGDYWYIVRGYYDPRSPYDYTQFHKLSKMLIQRRDIYCGQDFSWGDKKIYECAIKTCTLTKCNHGNMLTWVQINTNHHLTYAVLQISQTVSS